MNWFEVDLLVGEQVILFMIESAAKRLNGIVDFVTVAITNHYAQKYTEIYSDKYIYIDEHAS